MKRLNKLLKRIVWRGHDLDCWRYQWRLRRFEKRFVREHPNYCRACKGWGGTWVPDTRWEPGFPDPCEACSCNGLCPHCGAESLNDDNEYAHCDQCGWKLDESEGLPDLDDCGCWYVHSREKFEY